MHALAIHGPLPHLGFRYGRGAHPRTLAEERPETRQPTTPVRPLMSAAQRALLAAERNLFLQRCPSRRPRVRRRPRAALAA
jgi:hypothetical protein